MPVWIKGKNKAAMAGKVLVTGGAGFIGSHVVDAMLSEGYEVVIVDNLESGEKENVDPGVRVVEIDLRDPALSRVFQEHEPRYVCHLAAQASITKSIRGPLVDADANIIGSLNVLEECRKNGVEKVLFSSSGGAMYGEPMALPCGEDHPVRPLSPYGAAKAAVELYLPIYRSLYGLKYSALRYANVYGPRQNPTGEAGVVAIFAGRMLNGEQVFINGSGEQERDFIYVEDIARANVIALSAGNDEAFNLGSGEGTSVNEIFSRLSVVAGYRLKPEHRAEVDGEVFKIILNTDRARNVLGWEPRVSLEEGLNRTVESLRESRQKVTS